VAIVFVTSATNGKSKFFSFLSSIEVQLGRQRKRAATCLLGQMLKNGEKNKNDHHERSLEKRHLSNKLL
jgi:hypothetical protein